ncbi:heterokaryon incompatibility protein [Colletotrichum higginsianum]|nr:heterokaryon incompatibility protein [Colletotrichum higginsianum]
MPDKFKGKTFETWASEIKWHDRLLKVPHPFGQGRNKIKFVQDESNPGEIIEIRDTTLETAQDIGVIASVQGTGVAIQAGTQDMSKEQQAAILAMGGSFLTSILSGMDHKLPVVATIHMHNVTDADAGLLKVTVSGYGSKVQAPLSTLSSFNLRVASSYRKPDDGKDLRYGRIMNELVNVEEDCLYWVSHCLQHHGVLCAEPDWSSKLPLPSGDHFRLIDVENGRVVRFPMNGQQKLLPEYVALSYVWGATGKAALNLRRDNVSQLERRIDDLQPIHGQQQSGGQELPHGRQKKLARTISDGIEVARRLNIQYVWADSICVIQKDRPDDEEPAQDEQLKQMHRIFGHAAVVIVASSGKDSEAGLAGITTPRDPGQMAREVRPKVNVLLPAEYDESYGKWDTRAWTLQEKLLSKRMLVFGTNHVSFHCRHGILREDMPATHAGNGPPPIPSLSMPPKDDEPLVDQAWNGAPVLLRSPFFNEYAKLLELYTSRDLSNPGDTLKGMMGLLRVLENMRNLGTQRGLLGDTEGDHTLYGLPEEFLDLALLWQPPAVKGTYLTKRGNNDQPSWSWAGWEVSKDPTHDEDSRKNYKVHPGVRFEEPFWVSGNDDMTLRKFVATGNKAEERFKPFIMWYKWRKNPEASSPTRSHSGKPTPRPKPTHLTSACQTTAIVPPKTSSNPAKNATPRGQLKPVNGHGLGILCGSFEAEVRYLEKALEFRKIRKTDNPGPPFVRSDIPINDRHLVCETEVARFALRQATKKRMEPLWKVVDGVAEVEKELEIIEAEILDDSRNVVGHIIPTDQRKTISTYLYDCVLLSESQYWGNEKRIDVAGFPLYNVMVVEWDDRQEFATRVGLGKIRKEAWKKGRLGRRCVILK